MSANGKFHENSPTLTSNVAIIDDGNSQSIAKKKLKKKNKSKITSTTTITEPTSNAMLNECDAQDDIRNVGEELLKRLQLNGDKSIAGGGGPERIDKSTKGANVRETINMNNNNCKQANHVLGDKTIRCNGAHHKTETDVDSNLCENLGSSEETRNATVSATSSSPSEASSSQLPAEAPSDEGSSRKPVITFREYENELQMPDIMRVIQKELSEPYSIYTYRYFIHNWPGLCFLAMDGDYCVGAIVCKLDVHRQVIKRGYIAMLAVDKDYRKLKVGTTLVKKAIQVKWSWRIVRNRIFANTLSLFVLLQAMLAYQADEVVLETEITNIPALRLYENLGFVRDKRLFDYYLNGVDALRLKLWFK